MAEAKWIKIVTDIFDNRKIRLIRKMPDGAELVVTWFQILCLAGETNDNGLVYITKTFPYTEETLAAAFDTPIATVRLAIETFKSLEMIDICEDFLCICNWEKYQNIDGLAKIREQNRQRVAKHREKQRELAECNVTVTLPVTHCNATEEDKEIDKEDIPPLPPTGESSGFDEFWEAYPRKMGKGAARKSYAKVPKSARQKILIALEQQKRSTQWTREGGQYIPLPATWLNQGRWEDELEGTGKPASQKARRWERKFIDGEWVDVEVKDD